MITQGTFKPVIDLGGETAPRAFSFDALDRMANGVACGLLARGVARGEQAPAYQHPRFVWCIDALPLSSTNKVDRQQLAAVARTQLAAAVPVPSPQGEGAKQARLTGALGVNAQLI